MLKTLLSIVLTLALCLGLSVPALAASKGALNGESGKGTFAPGSPLTRGQLAQILYNMGWTYESVMA